MLENTDNDLPKASEDNVSEQTSKPTTKSNDDTVDDDQAVDSIAANKKEDVNDTASEVDNTKEDEIGEVVTEDNKADGDLATEIKEVTEEVPEEAVEGAVEGAVEVDSKITTVEKEQFENMELKELVAFFATTIQNESVQHIKPTVDMLASVFGQKLASLAKEKKEAFIASGENPDAFYFNPPEKKEFASLLRRYKSDRGTYYKSLEEKQQKNLAYRLQLIEELKGLINVEQEINIAYNQFKDLQNRWKESGQVPRMEANNIWKTYHHHVGHFYDFLHLNRELRELDFKFNLEQKLKICEQAEELASMEDISKAFRRLQTLHKKWKDELGPVDKDHSEQVWERFSEATKIIHDKRRYFIKNQEEVFEANLIKKQAILTQIKDLLEDDFNDKTNIHNISKTYDGLRESFFAVGRVPAKKRDDLWIDFKQKARLFSKKRNQFYKNLKKVYAGNVAKRKELIERANVLKTETNFRETTPKIIELQKEWKTLGPVSRKDHNQLWTRFRASCNEYFELMDASRNKASNEEEENLIQKTAILENIKNSIGAKDSDDKLDIDALVEKWNSIGRIPKNRLSIVQEFSRAVEQAYKASGLSKNEITQKSYKNKLNSMRDDDDTMRREIQSLNRRVDEIKQEVIQLETNLQFFGKNQESNPIVIKVRKDIAQHQERIDQLLEKKRLVKKLQKG